MTETRMEEHRELPSYAYPYGTIYRLPYDIPPLAMAPTG